MTRFAKHKKAKKAVGEDATPWEQMKEPVTEEGKRKEAKRLEKKRKRELKKVRHRCSLNVDLSLCRNDVF
jgi:hypothetical protein